MYEDYDPPVAEWYGVDTDPEREIYDNQGYTAQDRLFAGDIDPFTLNYQGTGMRVAV